MTPDPTAVVAQVERTANAFDGHQAFLVPETLLPSQFFTRPAHDSQSSPEKALMLAVLEDGIHCFQRHPRSLLARDAEAWIRTVGDPWPCSFDNVCDALGIDPAALRAALLAWKATQLAGRQGGPLAPCRVFRLHLRAKGQAAVG